MRPDASRAETSPVARPGLVDILRTGLVVVGGAPLLAASLASELRWPVDEASRLAKAQHLGRRVIRPEGRLRLLRPAMRPDERGVVLRVQGQYLLNSDT